MECKTDRALPRLVRGIRMPTQWEKIEMPTKKPRPKQVNAPVGSPQFEARMERQRARRAIDEKGVDRNNNGKADKREGRDVSHNVALSRGGSNKDGVTIEDSSTNRARKPRKRTVAAKTGGAITNKKVKAPTSTRRK